MQRSIARTFGTKVPAIKKAASSSIRYPQSLFLFASIRVRSRFKIFLQREVGAERPRRPTLGEEVGKMPTLIEDTGGAAHAPL